MARKKGKPKDEKPWHIVPHESHGKWYAVQAKGPGPNRSDKWTYKQPNFLDANAQLLTTSPLRARDESWLIGKIEDLQRDALEIVERGKIITGQLASPDSVVSTKAWGSLDDMRRSYAYYEALAVLYGERLLDLRLYLKEGRVNPSRFPSPVFPPTKDRAVGSSERNQEGSENN